MTAAPMTLAVMSAAALLSAMRPPTKAGPGISVIGSVGVPSLHFLSLITLRAAVMVAGQEPTTPPAASSVRTDERALLPGVKAARMVLALQENSRIDLSVPNVPSVPSEPLLLPSSITSGVAT